jgi:alanine dehydrogenase
VPRTAAIALTNATLPYVLELAESGWKAACRAHPGLAQGLNIVEGRITHQNIASAFDMDYHPLPYGAG